MNFTLSDCMQRINQILNYPSIAYEDISHFFDHAIAELNTILKVAIPSVSEMISDNTVDTTLQENTILLTTVPDSSNFPVTNTVPSEAPAEGSANYCYYFKNHFDKGFYVWNQYDEAWKRYDMLYGVMFTGARQTAYSTVSIGSTACWVDAPLQRTKDFNLCQYFPMDWWTLFIIPYVCFKFAVRNGDDGGLYQSEFTQGLQQLQTSYDVPNFVTLSNVAGSEVYTNIVKENLDNLSKKVPTRCVTEDMRVGNAISAVFENSMIGGWGL